MGESSRGENGRNLLHEYSRRMQRLKVTMKNLLPFFSAFVVLASLSTAPLARADHHRNFRCQPHYEEVTPVFRGGGCGHPAGFSRSWNGSVTRHYYSPGYDSQPRYRSCRPSWRDCDGGYHSSWRRSSFRDRETVIIRPPAPPFLSFLFRF
jgi:hypothetical protein